jgi:hypothetical protein
MRFLYAAHIPLAIAFLAFVAAMILFNRKDSR